VFRPMRVGGFLLIGAIAGLLGALGVIFVEQEIFIFGERLVAITPAVAYAVALLLILRRTGVPLGPISLILVPVAVYVSWYLAVQAGAKVGNFADSVPLGLLVGGVVGAGLVSLLLSLVAPPLREPKILAAICVAGAVGAVPFILSDQLGGGDTGGYFVLFVCWQALLAAATGHFLSRARSRP
jgi:hypothetical protein